MYYLITALYFRQSASVMLVEVRMSSASFTITVQQHTNLSVITLASQADASWKCSNLHFQQGHSSGVLKLNREGGCR